jgi:hypothetical protein
MEACWFLRQAGLDGRFGSINVVRAIVNPCPIRHVEVIIWRPKSAQER